MKKALYKTFLNFKTAFPIIIGVLMFVNLLNPILKQYYSQVFTGNYFIDPFIWAAMWSISFGIPIISYVTGWELLKEGVSLIAMTAFILTWSTVGIAFLPLETPNLGKKFTILRNILNFFTAVIIAILTVILLKIF